MAIRFSKFCGRATLIVFEALAVLIGLLALGAGLLIWRINSGPLDISFAKDYVQQEMRDPESGYSLTIGTVTTSWPDLKGPLILRLQNVSVLKYDRTILNVGAMELSLSKRALLLGQVAPQGILFSNPSLRLLRTENNNIVLSLRDELPDVTATTADSDNTLMTVIRSLTQPPGGKRSPFDRLRSLEIRDARMVMEDHVQGISWFLPNIDLLFLRDRQGLLLTANMALPAGPEAPSHIIADIAYNTKSDDIAINLALQNVNPHIITGKFETLNFLNPHDLNVTGEIRALMDNKLAVEDVAVDLSVAAGALVLPDLYEDSFPFESASLSARYDRAENSLIINRASLTAHEVEIALQGDFHATPQDIEGRITLNIPELKQEKITSFWPDSARDESAATWLTQYITGGAFTAITAALDLKGRRVPTADGTDTTWAVTTDNINAAFTAIDTRVDYRAPLPAAENVTATGTYENDTLTVNFTSGKVGGLTVQKGTVELPDLIHGTPGHVHVAVDLTGSVPAVFDYIKNEPIGMTGDNLGLDVAAARGDAALTVNVSFPALRDLPAELVKVDVTGNLNNSYIPGVVKNLALTGGPLALTVDNEKVKLEGNAKLDGRDTKLAWEQFLESKGKAFSGKVEASLIADKDLRDKLGIDLDDWLDGAFPVNVTYTDFGGGRSEASVRADLHNARLKVAPFKYEKPPGIPASATTTILLQEGQLKEVTKLTVATPELKIDNARLIFHNEKGEAILRRGSFPHATLGENDFALDLEVLPNGTMKLGVTGRMFDAQPFLNKDIPPGALPPPYTGPALLAAINVGTMRTHPGRTINNAKAYLDMAANGDIRKLEMDATAGRGALYLRLRPNQSGRMTIRLEADDAGAAMNAFGIYENVSGGKLIIVGEASDPRQPRLLTGQVQLNDFRAVNAPILARLVSAISPTGLAELLGSDGIYFARLESSFEWHMRKEGDLYVIAGGRTSGSSLGLTFEGKIDRAAQIIDINGHVVPVSMLNSLISSIPIVGTLLSGGSEGGVFAATYTITGPQKNPVVAVNPLSVLTPGIIRRILFENE